MMNILGVGLEIIDQRLWSQKARKSGKNFFAENFTTRERQYCENKRFPLHHYSARWACKIAAIQALGFQRNRGLMKAIEVKTDLQGRPNVHLDSKIASKKKDWKIKEIKVSLSHSDSYSAAEVIILGTLKTHDLRLKTV